MIGAMIMFVLLVIFYIIISDIITVFFRLTGMTEERARFQVISLLTNSGFTTQESEAVVNSTMRRRLATGTMLFGYCFTVTILSATFNVFMNLSKTELSSILVAFPMLIVVLVTFMFLRRASFFKRRFDHVIESLANQIMFGRNTNQLLLVEEYGEMVLAHIYLHTVPDILKDTTLGNANLAAKYQLAVMIVKPKKGEAYQAHADTVLQTHDTVMVLGKRKNIRTVFEK